MQPRSVWFWALLLVVVTSVTKIEAKAASLPCVHCLFFDFSGQTVTTIDAFVNSTYTNTTAYVAVPYQTGAALNQICFAGINARTSMHSFLHTLGALRIGAVWCKAFGSTTVTKTLPMPPSVTTRAPTTTPVASTARPTANQNSTSNQTGITTMSGGTAGGSTTAAPGSFTTAVPTPSVTATQAPVSNGTTTPAPTTAPPLLKFNVTFKDAAALAAFKLALQKAFGITDDQISVLATDGNSIIFTFSGTNAGMLSQQFNNLSDAQINTQFGITSRQSAPVSSPGSGGENNTMVMWIGVSVLGLIVIVIIAVFIRSRVVASQDAGRVNFHDYMQMANGQAKAGAGPPPPQQGQYPQQQSQEMHLLSPNAL